MPRIKPIKVWLYALAAWLLIAGAAFAQDPWIETNADNNIRVHLYLDFGHSGRGSELIQQDVPILRSQ